MNTMERSPSNKIAGKSAIAAHQREKSADLKRKNRLLRQVSKNSLLMLAFLFTGNK